MPILDSCHWEVVHALEKDGWKVNPKPSQFTEENSGMTVVIDLFAERNEDERLFVEVKCYPEKNRTQELYISFGQYILYRSFLRDEGINIPLYLSVPKEIYETRFHDIIRRAIEENDIKVVVVDLETETVSKWIG